MPERSTISQGIQIGKETVEGTGVAASKKLSSISITPRPNMEFSQFAPQGNKFNTISVLNREWSVADIEGFPTYTEIVYLLSSLMGAATITTPSGATNARQWEFKINPTSADAPVSYTVEKGDGSVAEKVVGLIVNSLSMGFSRTADPDLSGDAFGRQYQTGITLTGSPTTLALVPILPKDVSVYIDELSAGEADFGTTKLTRVWDTSINISDRYRQYWALDAAQDSYVATLETFPGISVDFGVMADSTGMGFLANARNGDTLMYRLEAIGDEIDTGVADSAYRVTIDAALKISDLGDMDDQDGALVTPYTGTVVVDPTWGLGIRIQVVNALTAL